MDHPSTDQHQHGGHTTQHRPHDREVVRGHDPQSAQQQDDRRGDDPTDGECSPETQALIAGLKRIEGGRIWTSPDPSRSAAVLSFQPGSLDVRKLSAALYQKDRIACATRGGQDRPGLRFSPHFYNTHADVEKAIAAVKKYVATGV